MITANAAEGTTLEYAFSGENADTAGYAEGTITLTTDTAGTYYLYWADGTQALDGYYEICQLTVEAGGSGQFVFDYHTAIPAGATAVIATTDKSKLTLADAVASYKLPDEKLLTATSGGLKYTFNSYSDVHIDPDGYYKNYEAKWAQALKFASDKNTDFIISSGDMVNNGRDSEWVIYEKILAESDYDNPVYEADGNHDLRNNVEKGLGSFVRATGTDNTIANYDAGKPYYYVKEETTGDLFIFMALEGDYKTHTVDSFSEEQMNWLVNLLETYYGTGINIYIIEHAPINGFGAGDRMDDPLYKSHLSQEFWSTVQFKSLLQKYPKLIWMSGHTHIDYQLGYNYSNENGTACHMIHNSAVIGSTWAEPDATSLDYNDGYGRNSQGYYVEVYENQVVYYGANLTDEKIYPAYCYIMDGARNTTVEETNETSEITTAEPTEKSATGSTLPSGIETKRVYFANTLNWSGVDCYSWSDADSSTCIWPGYGATQCGTDENGVKLYYCDIPADHAYIVWNNCDNEGQTKDITLDGVNNFFTPTTTVSSKEVTVTSAVWTYQEATDPPESSQPTESSQATESSQPTESSSETESTQATETTQQTESSTVSEYDLGDVNLDDKITVEDVTLLQKYLVKLAGLSQEQKTLADVDKNNKVNIFDATHIQRYLASIITEFPTVESEKKTLTPVGATSLATVLGNTKTQLESDYYFASYNQYQALKKLYKQYKNANVENEDTAITELQSAITALNTMVNHIGYPDVYEVRDTYYFVNTLGWSEIYGYAWTNDYNKAWPGLKLDKVGTHEGYDVYGIKFKSHGEYANLIFNSGTGSQTVDITLSEFKDNCFTINSSDMSDGKYIVYNFQYDNAEIQPTTPTEPAGESNYILRYYNGSAHAWDAKDTFFTDVGDGTYVLNFTTKNADSISCNVYDNDSGKYNCIASSFGFDYEAGLTQTFDLVASSSRGKSITINNLSAGLNITFVYNPTNNTLSITCG